MINYIKRVIKSLINLKYHYIISYAFTDKDGNLGIGRTEVVINTRLPSSESMKSIENALIGKYNLDKCIVKTFWITKTSHVFKGGN